MHHENKTKDHLRNKLAEVRQWPREMRKGEVTRKKTEEALQAHEERDAGHADQVADQEPQPPAAGRRGPVTEQQVGDHLAGVEGEEQDRNEQRTHDGILPPGGPRAMLAGTGQRGRLYRANRVAYLVKPASLHAWTHRRCPVP